MLRKNIPHLLHQRLFANSIFRVNYSFGSSLRKVLFLFSSFPSFFLLTISYWVWRPCLVPPTSRSSPASLSKRPQSCHGVISSSESSKTASILPRCRTFQRKAKRSVFMSFCPCPMGVINFQINREAQLSLETSTENSSPLSPTPYLCSWILNSWETSVHCRCDPSMW